LIIETRIPVIFVANFAGGTTLQATVGLGTQLGELPVFPRPPSL